MCSELKPPTSTAAAAADRWGTASYAGEAGVRAFWSGFAADQGTLCAFKFKFQILYYKRQIKYFQISNFAFQLKCHIHAAFQISLLCFNFWIRNVEREI